MALDSTIDIEEAIVVSSNETLIDETQYEYENDYNSTQDFSREDGLDNTRIVNGYTPPQRPWMAFLLFDKGRHMCGGSILNELYVVIKDENRYFVQNIDAIIMRTSVWYNISSILAMIFQIYCHCGSLFL